MDSQITAIINSLLDRLDDLRQLGIICRALPSTPGVSGSTSGNGTLTIAWAGDNAFTDQMAQQTQQEYAVSLVAVGQIRNLKEADGLFVIRDLLYARLAGYYPPQCTGSIKITSFVPESPSKVAWPFKMSMSVPALLAYGCEDDGVIGGSIEKELTGVPLAETLFATEVIAAELNFPELLQK